MANRRKPRRNPSGFFDAPESPAQQRARLEREAIDKKRRDDRQKLEDRAGKKLSGSRGDIGQGDMFGGGDLFSMKKNPMKKRSKKRSAKRRVIRRKARKATPARRKRRTAARRVRKVSAHRHTRKRRATVKRRGRKAAKCGYAAFRTGSKVKLYRVSGSKLSTVGTYSRQGLKKWASKHGVKVR